MAESPKPRSNTTQRAGSSPLVAEVDMEDLESVNSLSDDDALDVRLDLAPHDASSSTTMSSLFPSQNVSATTTPGAYFHSHVGTPDIMSQDLVFPENDSSSGMQLFQDGNQSSGNPASQYFGTDCFMTPPDSQMFELATPWSLTNVSPPSPPDELVLPGLDGEQGRRGSTMILEDVSPQTITKIINVLYEAKAVVKMKILSEE